MGSCPSEELSGGGGLPWWGVALVRRCPCGELSDGSYSLGNCPVESCPDTTRIIRKDRQ